MTSRVGGAVAPDAPATSRPLTVSYEQEEIPVHCVDLVLFVTVFCLFLRCHLGAQEPRWCLTHTRTHDTSFRRTFRFSIIRCGGFKGAARPWRKYQVVKTVVVVTKETTACCR